MHLKFVRKVYETQVLQGSHVEQPAGALSWKTTSLSKLPGLRCTFDQCRYGCECFDKDGAWKPVRKTNSLLTTKMSVHKEFQLHVKGAINTVLLKAMHRDLDFELGTWRATSR